MDQLATGIVARFAFVGHKLFSKARGQRSSFYLEISGEADNDVCGLICPAAAPFSCSTDSNRVWKTQCVVGGERTPFPPLYVPFFALSRSQSKRLRIRCFDDKLRSRSENSALVGEAVTSLQALQELLRTPEPYLTLTKEESKARKQKPRGLLEVVHADVVSITVPTESGLSISFASPTGSKEALLRAFGPGSGLARSSSWHANRGDSDVKVLTPRASRGSVTMNPMHGALKRLTEEEETSNDEIRKDSLVTEDMGFRDFVENRAPFTSWEVYPHGIHVGVTNAATCEAVAHASCSPADIVSQHCGSSIQPLLGSMALWRGAAHLTRKLSGASSPGPLQERREAEYHTARLYCALESAIMHKAIKAKAEAKMQESIATFDPPAVAPSAELPPADLPNEKSVLETLVLPPKPPEAAEEEVHQPPDQEESKLKSTSSASSLQPPVLSVEAPSTLQLQEPQPKKSAVALLRQGVEGLLVKALTSCGISTDVDADTRLGVPSGMITAWAVRMVNDMKLEALRTSQDSRKTPAPTSREAKTTGDETRKGGAASPPPPAQSPSSHISWPEPELDSSPSEDDASPTPSTSPTPLSAEPSWSEANGTASTAVSEPPALQLTQEQQQQEQEFEASHDSQEKEAGAGAATEPSLPQLTATGQSSGGSATTYLPNTIPFPTATEGSAGDARDLIEAEAAQQLPAPPPQHLLDQHAALKNEIAELEAKVEDLRGEVAASDARLSVARRMLETVPDLQSRLAREAHWRNEILQQLHEVMHERDEQRDSLKALEMEKLSLERLCQYNAEVARENAETVALWSTRCGELEKELADAKAAAAAAPGNASSSRRVDSTWVPGEQQVAEADHDRLESSGVSSLLEDDDIDSDEDTASLVTASQVAALRAELSVCRAIARRAKKEKLALLHCLNEIVASAEGGVQMNPVPSMHGQKARIEFTLPKTDALFVRILQLSSAPVDVKALQQQYLAPDPFEQESPLLTPMDAPAHVPSPSPLSSPSMHDSSPEGSEDEGGMLSDRGRFGTSNSDSESGTTVSAAPSDTTDAELAQTGDGEMASQSTSDLWENDSTSAAVQEHTEE